jgi:hypothetical protein
VRSMHLGRRDGRPRLPRRRLLLLLVALSALCSLPATSSAFSASTSDPANSVGADLLKPPTAVASTASCAVPAANPAFRAVQLSTPTGSANNTRVSSYTVTAMPATTASDTLIAVVTTSVAVTITAPASWTLIDSGTFGTATMAVYSHKGTGATYAFTSSAITNWNAEVLAFTGVATNAGYPVTALSSGVSNSAGSTTVNTGSTSPAIAPGYLLNVFSNESSGSWNTGAMTNVLTGSASSSGSIDIIATGRTYASAGAQTAGQAFSTATANNRGLQLAMSGPRTPQITTTWTSGGNATIGTSVPGYRLDRNAGATLASVGNAAVSYVDGTVVGGTSYTYRVWAYDTTSSWVTSKASGSAVTALSTCP